MVATIRTYKERWDYLMDKQKGKKEYVKLRIRLARDKIRVAKILLRNAEYRDVISRAYYAIYYAAKAFLLSRGEDPSSHKGVDILFHRLCQMHGKPSVNTAKIFSLMRQAHLNADYKEKVRITKKDAKEAIDMAESFLKEIQSLIKIG